MNNKKKNIIFLVGFLCLTLLMAWVYFNFSEKPVTGSKAITIEVINQAEEVTVYNIKTDAEYLRQAMQEAEGLTFVGVEGPYGLMVNAVNGETADYNVNGAYWSFIVNGQYCNYGIDQQPVNDQDIFQIIYTKG